MDDHDDRDDHHRHHEFIHTRIVGAITLVAVAVPIAMPSPLSPLVLSQHPDEHSPPRPILLAVDQQLGEGAGLRIAPELADPVGSLEVRQHQNVEELGAGSRTESIQARPESAFELIGTHVPEVTRRDCCTHKER